jgi:hypothetical protein
MPPINKESPASAAQVRVCDPPHRAFFARLLPFFRPDREVPVGGLQQCAEKNSSVEDEIVICWCGRHAAMF